MLGGSRSGGALVDCLDSGDFWDSVFEVSFDADAEGHVGGWAAYACAVHFDFDDAFGGDFDEFDVAAVVLDGRSYAVDDECDAVVEALIVWGRVVWGWLSHCVFGGRMILGV